MRCLGRLVVLLALAVILAVGWLYRGQLRRWIGVAVRPLAGASAAARPSAAALRQATGALDSMQRAHADSIVLSPDEFASLLARGAAFLPGATLDSLSVELGDRRLDVRTVIDSARVPSTLRALMPGHQPPYEELDVSGEFTPVRPGLAEFAVQGASVHGIPLPRPLVRDIARRITGRDTDRLPVNLPASVAGFRVRPSGVTIYRQGAR